MTRKLSHILLRLMPLLWTCFIWNNSLQPAVNSSAQSMQVLGLLDPLMQLLPDWLLAHAHFLIRKLAHAFEFAMLGALWYASLFAHPEKRRVMLSFSISVLTAAADETIQLFVPGRSGQFSDIVLDSSSSLLTILFCSLFFYFCRKRK